MALAYGCLRRARSAAARASSSLSSASSSSFATRCAAIASGNNTRSVEQKLKQRRSNYDHLTKEEKLALRKASLFADDPSELKGKKEKPGRETSTGRGGTAIVSCVPGDTPAGTVTSRSRPSVSFILNTAPGALPGGTWIVTVSGA